MKNAACSPSEDKYKSVKTSNPKINSLIMDTPGALDAMKELGWTEQEESLRCGKQLTMAHVRTTQPVLFFVHADLPFSVAADRRPCARHVERCCAVTAMRPTKSSTVISSRTHVRHYTLLHHLQDCCLARTMIMMLYLCPCIAAHVTHFCADDLVHCVLALLVERAVPLALLVAR